MTTSPDTTPAQKPKTTVAKLRCLDHRGETVHTRWGPVSFDKDGLAELEVPEGELQMLRDTKPFSWLADDHTSYRPDDAKEPEDKAGKKLEDKAGKKPPAQK